MRKIQNLDAVSEAVGEILLLAIAVTSVAVIYMQLSSAQGPQDIANVTILGKMEQGAPVFELQRGESLASDTKIIITVAGYDRRIFYVNQSTMRGTPIQEWDIGEQIVLPKEDVAGLQIEATIIDQKTNSIVFWGILQEGLVLPARGKGGIWHFDESLWRTGIPDEVKDSSGNENHGIARNGAKIINGMIQPQNVAHNNAGYFDGINDYVNVDTSWTLNITNTITVEAWMKAQNPQPLVDIIDLEEKFGYTPYTIPLFGTYYAIVSEDQAKRGSLATVNIDPEGNITYLQYTIFGNSTGDQILRPMITQMTENLYLVSYIDEKLYVHLKTYNISTNGSISYTGNELILKDYKSSINKPNRPSVQQINENLCAIAYWIPGNGGILRTVGISSTGKITDMLKMIQYDSVPGYEPCLVHVAGSVYALAYRGASDYGMLKTFNITSTGNITPMKTVLFEPGKAYEPTLLQVSGKVFAVAYRNSLNNGCIKTFNISSNGSIVKTDKTKIFENIAKCYNPCLVHYEEDLFVVAYSTGNSGTTTGYVMLLQLGKNGSIISHYDSRKEFKIEDRERCYNPIILHLSENLFAISFTGPTDHPGELITIFIGQETFPPYRGIFKRNSYGIFANASIVVGSINNIMVTYPNSAVWHHFAVTYDGIMIRLYVDGYLVNSTIYQNHQINKSHYDLCFGRYYCGYIDEIAVYDKALPQEQLLNHFINPGALE